MPTCVLLLLKFLTLLCAFVMLIESSNATPHVWQNLKNYIGQISQLLPSAANGARPEIAALPDVAFDGGA